VERFVVHDGTPEGGMEGIVVLAGVGGLVVASSVVVVVSSDAVVVDVVVDVVDVVVEVVAVVS
jgi:hypothetical protein